MVSRIDIPVRQVMIEARIVEAEDTFGRSLGVKLGSSDMRGIRGGVPGWNAGVGNLAIGGNYNAIGYQTNQSEQVDFSNTQFVNLPANTSSFGGASAANVAGALAAVLVFVHGATYFLQHGQFNRICFPRLG